MFFQNITPIMQGARQDVQVLELEFDEDIYFVDALVCGCYTSTTCSNKTFQPPIDEGALDIITLIPGQMQTIETNSTISVKYFKFTNPPPSNGSCPVVVITMSNIIGLNFHYISTHDVPNAERFLFFLSS